MLDVTFSAGWENTILGANREDHRRYRRILSNGFSAKAMQDQQPMMMKYVDLLLQRLHEHCDDGKKALDLVSWYNFTTFDLIAISPSENLEAASTTPTTIHGYP